jgi:DNA repair protein RecO (recombination protein O)
MTSNFHRSPSSLPRASLYRVEAVVLRHRDLGEADQALTLFTREHGKVRASVRGARKIKSRMGGHVEPLMHTSLLLVRGRSLDTVTQAQSIAVFPRVRENLVALTHGLHLAELVDRFSEEQEPNGTLFDHLIEGLVRLEKGESPEFTARAFEMRLLEIGGYRPVLDRCVSCDSPFDDGEQVSFGAGWGGTLCSACAADGNLDARQDRVGLRPVSKLALAGLRSLQDRGYLADRSSSSSGPIADEIERLLLWYLQSVLERPLETAAFLDELRSQGPAGPR